MQNRVLGGMRINVNWWFFVECYDVRADFEVLFEVCVR